MHKHIDSIPEQHRDASKVDLILKAVDDSKYRLNEETMREAFARLIANGLDNRINAEFFPAYSEILSNMSVQEAILLKLLYSNTGTQIATEQLMSENKTTHATHPIASRVYLFDDKTDTSGQFTIPVDLLQRSGLINSSETNFLSHEYYTRQYTAYENQFNQLKDTFPGMSDDEELAFRKGFIDFTTFGKSFVKFIV
ncbi:DUF4393 domain-containing protein [Loigolactobacillus coryniformis]|uniref:DUF4393 domain-containing protein n=1 Tax=Loigolactobacillus coryniformis TaxID=1610 RepID=UPI00285251D2|nr:DUF4393 domain-containing protein [Loigolactobacillus coryniformis]